MIRKVKDWNKAKISFDPIAIKEAGFMFVYLSYENESNNWVYFDDFKVVHTKSNVIQYNEYYPFGMQTANSCLPTGALAKVGTREGATGNNFLGNGGTEFNTTSNLYDLDYRNYDPVLGRMNGVDPMASKYASLTPYNFSFNDPVSFTDPSGADPYGYYEGAEPIFEPYTSWMYSPGYGWLQDDVIYQRLIGWSAPVARYVGRGLDWMFGKAGTGPAFGGWKTSTFAGIHLPYIAQLRADAQAVKSGQMSLEEYAARHGSSPTQNDIQYLANALGLDVMGMDGNNAWLQVNLKKAVYAGGLDAGNQIAMGTYGVINVALGVGRKDLLNALSKTNSSQTGPLMAGGPPSYTPPPKDGFPGFPDAEPAKRKGGRPRWKLPDGDIIEWDGQHRELERYNPRGKHKGVWNPQGEMIKDPVPGRTIDPFVTPWYIPSKETMKNVVTGGLIIGGAAIIIFDILTIPSGEGLIGVQMIGAGLGGR